MPTPLVDRSEIRLAMLGYVEGNGHPYSWSAMFNGYDPEEMASCPYAGIPQYLNKEPKDTLQIEGARVTHIWADDPAIAAHVSRASLVPNVVDQAEDVIGEVDAVIVATDRGYEHVERCRPFVEAGLPIFVDKPLADNEEDLVTFNNWAREGHAILSSSALRYSKELMPYRHSTHELGEVRYISATMAKTWEFYGIHGIELIYPLIGPGFVSCRHSGTNEHNIMHFRHASGCEVVIACIKDMLGGFGDVTLAGTLGSTRAKNTDTFFAFKSQLQAYVNYLRTGERPFPWAETVETIKMVIAGLQSREQGGAVINLAKLSPADPAR